MKALSKFVEQLAHNASEQPGWIPLLLLCYFLLPFAKLPEHVVVFGHEVKLSEELLAAALTLALFMIGDSLDKGVYKSLENRLPPEAVGNHRDRARDKLHVCDGVYDVAKKLASAAGWFQTRSVQFLNETAKFLRSLVIPVTGIGLGIIPAGHFLPGLVLLVIGVALVPVYVRLKAAHIRHLYELVPKLRSDSRYCVQDLGNVRLFFWDGVLVASALRWEPENKPD